MAGTQTDKTYSIEQRLNALINRVGLMQAAGTDATTFTVTGTGNAQASKSWSIPAGDADVGTVYRVTVWGFGTEGTTVQDLKPGLSLAGSVIRSGQIAGLTPVSAAFRFKAILELHILTTGTGGTADCVGDVSWATTAGPAVSGVLVFGSPSAGAETINTTIANNFRLSLAWAANVGGPTITTYASMYERLGP